MQTKLQGISLNRRLVERFTPGGSMQQQMMLVLGSFIVGLLILINTYPVVAMRNVVYTDKEQSMSSTASVVSSALSGLDVLTADNVGSVIELLNVTQNNHILITNPRGVVIYDSWGENQGANLSADYDDIAKVFTGILVFDSEYDGRSFTSQVCAPVQVGSEIIGSVYLIEEDTEQADMITGIRNRLLIISVAVGLLAIALSVAVSRALTVRIRDLAGAVRIVQEGDYTGHIEPRGSDEITELTREFNSMTDILRVNEQVRRQFVSDASHELKTPLASIRLLSDSILQNDNIDRETTVEFVEDISTAAQRLQLMTEKLLDLSRMDSDAPVQRRSVDLSEVAGQCLPILRPLAANRQVTLELDAPRSVEVYAAEEDVYQIVFNLAENAIKYNVAGGSVTIRVKAVEDTAVLIVADTGIGIPQEDRENIFARFYRVDKARSREAGGSGLGLSIVRDAVQLHGGTITVTENVPQGTVFTVELQLVTDSGD